MKHGNEHVKTECREYGVFSAYCVVATERWRTPRNMYERRTGGREWESNPPRTGKRLFPGFEVRTPHRGRFSSFLNHRNCLMAWTTGSEGARTSPWTPTGSEAARMAFYSVPLTIAAMTLAPPSFGRKRNDSVAFGRPYNPGTEPVRRLLAGVSGIAARRAVRAVTIPAPMRVRAMLVAVGTVEMEEPAGTSVRRTDPARVGPTYAAPTVYTHAQATPAAVRDRGVPCRGARDSRHDGNADKHHAHHDAHSICRSCTQADESILRLPLSCAVRRSASATQRLKSQPCLRWSTRPARALFWSALIVSVLLFRPRLTAPRSRDGGCGINDRHAKPRRRWHGAGVAGYQS
jgi:hypothetical protein